MLWRYAAQPNLLSILLFVIWSLSHQLPPAYDLQAYSRRLNLPLIDAYGAVSFLRGAGIAGLSAVWAELTASSSIVFSSLSCHTFSALTLLQAIAWSAVLLFLLNRSQLKFVVSSSSKMASVLRPYLPDFDGELAQSPLLMQLLVLVTVISALQVIIGLNCYRVSFLANFR